MVSKLDQAARLHQEGHIDRAASLYEDVLARDPQNARALNLLGVVASQRREFVEAIGLMSRSIALRPNQAEFHHNLAAVFRTLGNFAESEHHYRRAVQLRPDYAEAYFNLSAIRRFAADDPIVPALKTQLQSVDAATREDQCFLHFAAGKIFDDLRQHDRAFTHYLRGNAARGATFDREAHEAQIDRIISVFDRGLFESRDRCGEPNELPIFIVGMPRSGTTLLEQILTSHGDVVGLGELPDIPSIAHTLPQHAVSSAAYPECVPSLGDEIFAGFGRAYLKRVSGMAPGARRTVDKLPGNFMYVGLIALMLPRAKIIHCRRNRLDTCLSCFFHRFREGHEYSFDLEDLGHYHLAYERLMAHWRNVLPVAMFDLEYESLVDDQERVSRELFEFCGLTWDQGCLDFHRADRPVTTASNWQVRQPLYKTAMARWKNYEAFLRPLQAVLKGADSHGPGTT
jgi:tetratricopeptide (TPR) repeat protein